MLGAAQANALGAELAGHLRIPWGIGIAAHTQLAIAVRPLHELGEIPAQVSLDQRYLPEHDRTRRAINGQELASVNDLLTDATVARPFVDHQRPAAHHTALPHATCYHGGVGSHPTPRRDNPLCRVHATDVFGGRLRS